MRGKAWWREVSSRFLALVEMVGDGELHGVHDAAWVMMVGGMPVAVTWPGRSVF